MSYAKSNTLTLKAHPTILQYFLLAYNSFVLDRGAAVNVCCARDCEAIFVEHCLCEVRCIQELTHYKNIAALFRVEQFGLLP